MNWEDAYRQECKKLEEVRVELKEREEEICEMQLLLNTAKQLSASHIGNVSEQLFEEAVDFGKWLLRNTINIGKYDKDNVYEVCELYQIWKDTKIIDA